MSLKNIYIHGEAMHSGLGAPVAEVLGPSFTFLIAATIAAISLILVRLYRPTKPRPLEHPRYYLSGISSYLAGEERVYPRRDLLFMARSLRELGYPRRWFYAALIMVSIGSLFSFIYPFSRGLVLLILRRFAGGV